MNTTSTAAKAAVAENISTFRAAVSSASAREKTAVNTITNPIRTTMRLTKYNTRMTKVGRIEEIMAPKTLLTFAMRFSEYFRISLPWMLESNFLRLLAPHIAWYMSRIRPCKKDVKASSSRERGNRVMNFDELFSSHTGLFANKKAITPFWSIQPFT